MVLLYISVITGITNIWKLVTGITNIWKLVTGITNIWKLVSGITNIWKLVTGITKLWKLFYRYHKYIEACCQTRIAYVQDKHTGIHYTIPHIAIGQNKTYNKFCSIIYYIVLLKIY